MAFHIQKKTCASCGFPAAKIRGYNWSIKVMNWESADEVSVTLEY